AKYFPPRVRPRWSCDEGKGSAEGKGVGFRPPVRGMRILPAGLSHLSVDGAGVGFPRGKNQPGQVGRRRKNGRDPGSGGADRPVPGVSGLRSRLSGGGALRADPGGGEGGSGPGAKGCALPAGGEDEGGAAPPSP